MPTNLCVRADASSILRNILNYFSDNFACIQELLQNARRAEASDVRVEIDTRVGVVSVSDNGHGVIDPEDLVNIGRSEWADGVKAERPAGMGLFSVFKLGGLAEVRSGRWRLTLDYPAMCAGKAAVYEGLLPSVKGTQVTVRRLHHQFGGPEMPHPEAYADRWQRQAEFMPFRTTITVDGTSRVVEPYDPRNVPPGAVRVPMAWGFVDLHSRHPDRGDHADACLIQQGLSIRLKGLSGAGDMPWVRIHARPGTVNFTLPDRDAILEDAQFRAVMAEVRQACVQAVVEGMAGMVEEQARKRLAGLVYAWDLPRVVDLPQDLQILRLRQDREYLYTLNRQQVGERLAKGALACAFEPRYHTAFELVPDEMLQLVPEHVALFKAMFPTAPVVAEFEFAITADDRSDLLWRCGEITYRFADGETRKVEPVADQAVLADGDLNDEFVPDNRERANFRSGNDFAVVHSCDEAVMYPNLDPWHTFHEKEMDQDQADELWRTSDLAVHIASTWPGVPANDVTPDELVTLLRDRLADGKDCRLRFANAKFELGWGNQLSIRSMLVEVVENGKVTRKVRLVENCGYLQEVTP